VPQYFVKSPVFPFNKFPGVDPTLGPEMRSTGEVMGVSTSYGQAFAKAQLAAGQKLPLKGTIFLSVNDRDKRQVGPLGKDLKELGFRLLATRGTAAALEAAGIEAEPVFKVNEGRPNIVDLVKTRKIDLIINTPLGRESFYDEKSIRRTTFRASQRCRRRTRRRWASRHYSISARKSARCRIYIKGACQHRAARHKRRREADSWIWVEYIRH